MTIHPKPKPPKRAKKSAKKDSPFCRCKPLYLNRDEYKTCAKCGKPYKENKLKDALEKMLDETVKKIVLFRDGYCVCPAPPNGHGKKRQPGHLISRGRKSVKYDLRNVNEQCDSCNCLHENYPEIYNNWYANKFGLESYNELCADKEKVVDLTVDYMEALLLGLQEIYKLQQIDSSLKPRFTQEQILTGEWKTINGLRLMTSYPVDKEMKVDAV